MEVGRTLLDLSARSCSQLTRTIALLLYLSLIILTLLTPGAMPVYVSRYILVTLLWKISNPTAYLNGSGWNSVHSFIYIFNSATMRDYSTPQYLMFLTPQWFSSNRKPPEAHCSFTHPYGSLHHIYEPATASPCTRSAWTLICSLAYVPDTDYLNANAVDCIHSPKHFTN